MRIDRGWPSTWRGRLALRTIALLEIIANLLLLPVALLWYGLHELPSWLHDAIRPAVKTLYRGQAGPHKGILW